MYGSQEFRTLGSPSVGNPHPGPFLPKDQLLDLQALRSGNIEWKGATAHLSSVLGDETSTGNGIIFPRLPDIPIPQYFESPPPRVDI